MTQHASGAFEVRLTRLDAYNAADASFGRRALNKQFHGDLEAGSKGEMLSVGGPPTGGYVAMERVTGVLQGRRGSFALMHTGTITAGVPQLDIVVVPGSGTGELEHLAGRMRITIAAGGAHAYDFVYTLEPGIGTG